MADQFVGASRHAAQRNPSEHGDVPPLSANVQTALPISTVFDVLAGEM
jgi:hypothetical protein